MIDKIAIQETLSLYHEGGSRADWDQVMATFLPNGIWEVPGMKIFCQGHEQIRAGMTAVVAPMAYLVQINAPAVIVVEGDKATARSLVRECAKLRDRDGLIDAVGQYADELERTAEGWKFARRTFTILGRHTSAAVPRKSAPSA